MLNPLRKHLVAIGIIAFANPAHGDWPTDTTSPLHLGDVLGFGAEHVAVSTPDGATWVAWIDGPCFPSLFVQRLGAGGTGFESGALVLDTQDDCVSLTLQLEALSDNTVIVTAIGSDPLSTPVHRITADGQELWPPSVVADDIGGGVHEVLALPDGNAMVASQNGTSIDIGHYEANGTRIWNPPASFATGGGSNMRIFALESDGAGGVYVLWDAPGAYTRVIHAMRILADGTQAWASPTLMVSIPPGSSRHTDPVAIADGLGGIVLVWTQGAEQGTTPVPLRMQRLFPDGTMLFDMSGARVSTSTSRQFDAQIIQRVTGGDIYIGWRDGPFDTQVIRTQRMNLNGQRQWGDEGTLVTPIASPTSAFTLNWLDENTLGIAVSSTPLETEIPRVNLYRANALGQIEPTSWPVSGTVPASRIDSASLGDALAVVWLRDGPGNLNEVVAQRINNDGSYGLADTDSDGIADIEDNCTIIANSNQIDVDGDGIGNLCDPDFNNDCVVNFIDYAAITAEFLSTSSPLHDLNSDGVVNFIDIAIFPQFIFLPPGPSSLSGLCDSLTPEEETR